MSRPDGRGPAEPRSVEMIPHFHRNAEGSVLYRAGGTVVLCTASIDANVPAWMAGKGKGWLTAEYQMHPRASRARRDAREGRGNKAMSGRTQEIQRLIGRALRSAIDLEAIGERTIVIDCDVLEADGGTRTASITGGFVAMSLALARLRTAGTIGPMLRDQVAAISVGHVGGETMLDLVYEEDSQARMDLNVVGTARGAVVEVQATAEGEAIERRDLDRMIDLGLAGVTKLVAMQRGALANAGAPLGSLFQAGRWEAT